jgi:hypothetical protein
MPSFVAEILFRDKSGFLPSEAGFVILCILGIIIRHSIVHSTTFSLVAATSITTVWPVAQNLGPVLASMSDWQ